MFRIGQPTEEEIKSARESGRKMTPFKWGHICFMGKTRNAPFIFAWRMWLINCAIVIVVLLLLRWKG